MLCPYTYVRLSVHLSTPVFVRQSILPIKVDVLSKWLNIGSYNQRHVREQQESSSRRQRPSRHSNGVTQRGR